MSDNNSGSFDFKVLGLGSVLRLNRLSVPVYQREYAWKEEKVSQLLSDLQKARNERSDYFLGTVVTTPKAGGDTLDVVDGQQRLTTTALFLAAVRDHILKHDPNNLIVESIENEFLTTIDRRQGKRVPRLHLNVDDHAYFSQLVSREGPTMEPRLESHRRLSDAKKFISNFITKLVSTYDENGSIALLNEWINFVENKASVILLKAPDPSYAFRMFETLNDRGQKTSQADLVKNYLFEKAGDRIVEAQARWSSMLSTLEEIDDEDRHINFLRHILIATRAFTRADQVFNTVQGKIRGEADALQFLSDLERLASVYVATYRPDSDQWSGYPQSALKAIKVLSLLDLKPFRPLILSVVEKFSPVEGAKALALFVSIGVRILIAGRTNSGQIEQNCAQAALAVYTAEVTTTSELRDRLDGIIPADGEFQQLFATATSAKTSLARYYLRSLELARLEDNEPYFEPNEDPDSITLEHVLPKKPEANWPQFDADAVKRYTRRIGNLCLLQKTPNSNLKSSDFDKKKAVFKDAKYVLTADLAGYERWDAEAVEKRQLEMAELAVKAWPVGRAKRSN